MSTSLPHSVRLVSSGLAALLMASCAVPPREAWQAIQTRGLFAYIQDGRPLGAAPQTRMLTQTTTSTVTPMAPVSPVRHSTPPPAMLNTASMPVAQAVPDLPGYVRTPFTNPPRLVDVRGMAAGSKVVCPYTQRPFLVPGGVSIRPSSVASTPAPSPAPVSSPAPAPSKPKVDAPERPRTAPVTPNTNVAAMNNGAAASTTQPEATPPPSPAADLPFGTAITGRLGFVNSPYAAKHQLVDVTGLPVGMEVKCPYTGKLFRVPPQ